MFPAPASRDGSRLRADALTSLVVNRGLGFPVRVPERNQPKKRANDKVPAEYQAIWDGILILITWRIPTSTSLPLSGGHVVAEILSDALARLNFSLYVQGCNPVCTHGFAHTDIRFIEEEDFREAVDYTESSRLREVHALVPPLDDRQLMEGVFSDLRIVTHRFSLLKNLGRRILEAERDGHKTLESLMEINYMRATLPTLPLVERYRKRWETGGWLPKTRLLIARAWMGLAYIESLRQEWNKLRLEFERNAKIRGKYHLFVRDYADEVDRVKSLDLELMRSGLQEIAERLDSRALLRVTATAAIAGAVAGGIVGAIAGAVSEIAILSIGTRKKHWKASRAVASSSRSAQAACRPSVDQSPGAQIVVIVHRFDLPCSIPPSTHRQSAFSRGACFVSKLDANSAFEQLAVAPLGTALAQPVKQIGVDGSAEAGSSWQTRADAVGRATHDHDRSLLSSPTGSIPQNPALG